MFRKILILAGVMGVTLISTPNIIKADIIYVSGDVSGTWSADTVIVTGEVRVPPQFALIIRPGVEVLFQVNCKFIVDSAATLLVLGTEQNSILFDELTTGIHWHGIRFLHASDSSHLEYCHLTHGQATRSREDNFGGGIYCSGSNPTFKFCVIDNCSSDQGGGIYCTYSSPVIYNNIITLNYGNPGGGIHCLHSNPLIHNNILLRNSSGFNGGAGIYCGFCDPTIGNNIITENSGFNCAGIYCNQSNPNIYGNILNRNSATYGGGIYCYANSDAYINDNILYQNSANYGSGIRCYSANPIIVGNIVLKNTDSVNGGGAYALINSHLTLLNTILWNNTPQQIYYDSSSGVQATYSDIQSGWPGLGNIDEYPAFLDTAHNDYRLLWGSPCIDSCDPDPQYNDPDGTRADMGAFYYDQSMPVRILLTPHEIPYLIEPEGGTMDYTIRADNIDSAAHTITVWCNLTLPDSTAYGPVLGPVEVTIGPSATLTRIRTQNVPAAAPMGVYHYNAYTVMGADTSKDSFMWGKLGADIQDSGLGGWNNYGEPITDAVASSTHKTDSIHPSAFILYPCSPNPFNPTTTLSFALPEASNVNLAVFDVSGRLVSTLLDGWRDAGTHEVTFDGSNLASGIYIYQLHSGKFVASGKMVLIK